MTFTPISSAQMKRLQTLCSQSFRALDIEPTREHRLAWAEEELGKKVESFKALSAVDAKRLIDRLQATMGIRETSPARRRPRTQREAVKLGTEGRHDQVCNETTILDGTEDIFRLIQAELTILGWDERRLQAFLRSPRGPNKGRDTIRTLGDANRAHWALKRITERQLSRATSGNATDPKGASA